MQLLLSILVLETSCDTTLVLCINHLLVDGYSLSQIFLPELAAFYNFFSSTHASSGIEEGLRIMPSISTSFADFVHWERCAVTNRNKVEGKMMKRRLTYWMEKLHDLQPLSLKGQKEVSKGQPLFVGSSYRFSFPGEMACKVRTLCSVEKVTPFILLIATLQVVLSKYSDSGDDFAIGTPTSNRPRNEFEPVIGYFVQTLLIRSCIPSDGPTINTSITLAHFFSLVKNTCLEAFDNQYIPYEVIERHIKLYNNFFEEDVFDLKSLFLHQVELSVRPPQKVLLPNIWLLKDGEPYVELEEPSLPVSVLPLSFTVDDLLSAGDRVGAVVHYNVNIFEKDFVVLLTQQWVRATELMCDFLSDPLSTLQVFQGAF
eukprot:TRINITY_DN19679_c0_g1_i1.p1 TRINITY_DN19679_c0_g1~~TRINITY_DN19679_c0_g1_i1.p1  ORF type:complete len:386 (-),score=94.68 TRINITY_DN19679_c0_g1_i1:146-1258(-)